jgi:hypothetical protein
MLAAEIKWRTYAKGSSNLMRRSVSSYPPSAAAAMWRYCMENYRRYIGSVQKFGGRRKIGPSDSVSFWKIRKNSVKFRKIRPKRIGDNRGTVEI